MQVHQLPFQPTQVAEYPPGAEPVWDGPGQAVSDPAWGRADKEVARAAREEAEKGQQARESKVGTLCLLRSFFCCFTTATRCRSLAIKVRALFVSM